MSITNYTQAVTLAKAGEQQGFDYLYEHTFQSKYFLALQYMKNEESAKDVMQEAYMKAFTKLEQLDQPETFPGWFGAIVANTAKNMLAKKNPTLFSELAGENEDYHFEEDIREEDIGAQPEAAYTQKETQTMLREMIDSLSDEQRMCILMFHLEGASIRQIADALNCSENTIKSRLNYGRKNLKAQAEDMQRRGVKLYGLAPLPLLLLLLRAEEKSLAASPLFQTVKAAVAEKLVQSADIIRTGAASAADSAAKGGANLAAKTAAQGFLHTTAAKVGAAVLGLCLVGGAAMYGITHLSADDPKAPETNAAEEATPKQVKDEDYAKLIAGNLTKEELEFALAYGPGISNTDEISDEECTRLIFQLCAGSAVKEEPIAVYEDMDSYGNMVFSTEDVNRLYASFTDFRVTADSISSNPSIQLDGDRIGVHVASVNYSASAAITSAEYTADKMEIYYDHEYATASSDSGGASKRKATLTPNKDGLFQIVKIEEATEEEPEGETENTDTENAEVTGDGRSIKDLYGQVLADAESQCNDCYYFLYDMTGDGISELFVGALLPERTSYFYDFQGYSCEKQGAGYSLKTLSGNGTAEVLYTAPDGNGLYRMDFIRGTGAVNMYRVTVEGDRLSVSSDSDYAFTFGDEAYTDFTTSNSAIQWTPLSDLSTLEAL